MPSPGHAPARFVTTQWSIVVAAGDAASPDAPVALEHLCRSYWQPLYQHVRRLGYEAHVAQDLIQAFFAHVLENRVIDAADQIRGKFRTFLLTALRNFLANERAREQAAKRGGGRVFPMDFQSAETAYQIEPSREPTPEKTFERQWAITVLEESLTALEQRQRAAGKAVLFEALAPCLTAADDAPDYTELSARLGVLPDAVKKAASRLRAQYAQAIRDEVRRTISDNDAVDDEIKSLFRALQR